MFIPEDKVEEIRSAVDIVDLVSGYVTLKRVGRNYVGLCPFHTEKTPSFSVSPHKQIFYCFGCGAGGNVFNFLMRSENVNFVEAIQSLAERYHIKIPESSAKNENQSVHDAFYEINRTAARFYYDCLVKGKDKSGLSYLQGRGIDTGTIKRFGLGYSPDAWAVLTNFFRKEKLDIEQVAHLGLVIPREKGNGHYDRFRGRVMFPIMNPSGRVIGFGGRRLKEDNTPKYLNSPESTIYHKSQSLFGLYQSRESIRQQDEILLVEGYTDVIGLYRHGVKNAVASSGTAFTAEQATIIRRYTKNVVIVYDGDTAGAGAAVRAAAILLEASLNAKVALLPPEHDPDSFVRNVGVQAFGSLIENASEFVPFRLAQSRRKGQLKSVQQKTEVAKEVMAVLTRISDPITRSLHLQQLAAGLGIDLKVLSGAGKKAGWATQTGSQQTEEDTAAEKRFKNLDLAQRNLLRVLLEEDGGRYLKDILEHVSSASFADPVAKEIFEVYMTVYKRKGSADPNEVLNGLKEESSRQLIARIMIDSDADYDRRKVVEDCLITIKRYELKKRIRENQAMQDDLENAGKDIKQLQKEWVQLKSLLTTLDKQGLPVA